MSGQGIENSVRKFNQINFNCIKCGSSNLTKNDAKTGISLTDVPNALFASAFITCDNCEHRFFVNMEDHDKINWWYNEFIIITTEYHVEFTSPISLPWIRNFNGYNPYCLLGLVV